jgi:hypothetical protein
MRPGFRSISTSACSQEFMAPRMISAAGLLAFRERDASFSLTERAG